MKKILTPELIKSLDYHSKCLLAEHCHVVDPTKVKINGLIELDELGNITSIIEATVK